MLNDLRMKCDLPSYVSSEGLSDDKNLPSAMKEREREMEDKVNAFKNPFEISN